jgi:uncharacterized protein YbaR (Trm112 family)
MPDKGSSSFFVSPTDRTPLSVADDRLISHLNRVIAAGRIVNRAGKLVDQPLGGGLLTNDKAFLYPIMDGIPILLSDEAIPLSQLDDRRGVV